MKAVLICIGDEILTGTTVDTNSNFISGALLKLGISVSKILTVSDEVDAVQSALCEAFEITDLVITTGGLGPTKDDKTKKAFCEFFDDELKLDQETFQHLKNLLQKRKREHLLEINIPQAEIPSKATVFQNYNGTAPGLMMQENGKTAICLPGVPYEVKPLIKDQVIPFLKDRFDRKSIVERIISVVNYPESLLSKDIEQWELSLPENISLSYLPVANRVKLKLTAKGKNEKLLNEQIEKYVSELRPLIKDFILAEEGDKIEEILHDVLSKKKHSISVAESCTGGELSKLITSVKGSSGCFLGGIVAYDYHKKIEILGVSEKTIQEKTVVSEEVAQEMSLGCQKLFGTDIAISTTGVAGPSEDEFRNKVGLVYYSIRVNDSEQTFKHYLPHLERKDFMNFVSMKALQDLILILTAKS